MGQRKGFTGNPNGRPKGTPNKTTSDMKLWVNGLVGKNQKQFERDLKKVDPEKRLAIIEKLLAFCIPKQQSISVEAQISAEYAELEQLLEKAPTEAVEAITARIMELRGKDIDNG